MEVNRLVKKEIIGVKKEFCFEIEEHYIASTKEQNNGAGPMWNFGSPTIIRHKNKVFATVPEVGEGVKPLSNTRWRLYMKEDGSEWRLIDVNEKFDEREPCLLVRLQNGDIYMSTNPAQQPLGQYEDGRIYWRAMPKLLKYSADEITKKPETILPVWDREYSFTDHSYRGIAADSKKGDILLLNVDGYEGYAWSYLNKNGEWSANGKIKYPERGCYPHVALKNEMAYVMAVEDIIEPNEEWRRYKFEQTGRTWDYVFRRIYFTYTPKITKQDFSEQVIIADYDKTAGATSPRDMWIDQNGDVHIIYISKNVEQKLIRDKFFPELAMVTDLVYCKIREGNVIDKNILVRYVDNTTINKDDIQKAAERSANNDGLTDTTLITDEIIPTDAIVNFDGKGNLYTMFNGDTNGKDVMYIIKLLPQKTSISKVPLNESFHRFFSASERMGSDPSNIIDLFGMRELDVFHIQIKLEDRG